MTNGSDDAEFTHVPVMLREVVELLGAVPPGLVVDATLGGAGHAAALLDAGLPEKLAWRLLSGE